MHPDRHSYGHILLIVALPALLASSACRVGPPSSVECIERWNGAGNRRAQAAVAEMGLPHVRVAGWPTKAGDHCSAMFFSHLGKPWVMYVLWVDAPEPTSLFSRNAGGSHYGMGELGAERTEPPNAQLRRDGTLQGR